MLPGGFRVVSVNPVKSMNAEERRFEILEFLEKLMDVAEAADSAASKIIFKGQLGMLMPQKDGQGGKEGE